MTGGHATIFIRTTVGLFTLSFGKSIYACDCTVDGSIDWLDLLVICAFFTRFQIIEYRVRCISHLQALKIFSRN